MRWIVFYLVAGSLFAALFTSIVMRWGFGGFHHPELWLSWAVVGIYGMTGAITQYWATQISSDTFPHWRLGINGIRVIVFVALIVLVRGWGIQRFTPFVIVSFTGYLCFLFTEVLAIYLESLRYGTENGRDKPDTHS